MRRRQFIAATTAIGAGALAGCTGGDGGGDGDGDGAGETTTAGDGGGDGGSSGGEPDVIEDRPDAVYMPTHVEGMYMAGTDQQGEYTCALTYSFPHRFWLVTGSNRELVELQPEDSMHMMPVMWDTEEQIVPPDANPTVTITRDGDQVEQFSSWPMLSQRMGFHFGDNVQLPEAGTYRATVEVGSPSTKRTGAFADREFGAPTFEFEFEFGPEQFDEIMYRDIPEEEEGTRGAAEPMSMEMMPTPQLPGEDSLSGTVRGSATSGDARFVVTTFDDAAPFGGSEDESYLAVSPRTPHSRFPLPLMSLSGTLRRGGETVFDDFLTGAVDPELNAHYGATVSGVEAGDDLEVTVDAPPQLARHEGYETAFFDMESMSITL